ncbi:MAG: hypothetical protein RQ867_09115 [Mariprofundaceae bacterium]|nr:hypothetical protein [Mariprofundaceae bacterium]
MYLCLMLPVATGLSVPAAASAGSNLSAGYPSHRCHKPAKPPRPDSLNNRWRIPRWELDAYNSSVSRYNAELEIYNGCITRYVENANEDIERIRQKAGKAVLEANSQTDE